MIRGSVRRVLEERQEDPAYIHQPVQKRAR